MAFHFKGIKREKFGKTKQNRDEVAALIKVNSARLYSIHSGIAFTCRIFAPEI